MEKVIKQFFGIAIVAVLVFVAVKPLFANGYFPMHDDTQPSRIYEMAKSLKMGMFPVRWVPDLGYGYGYPIYNFYAPLSYYIGGVLVLFGIGSIMSAKLTFILAILASGIFMYLFVKKIYGEVPAIVSCAFYILAPYHAVDLYVRGDLAELWAYAFIPLVFLGLYQILQNKKAGIITGSLGLAFVILSHNLTALMLVPFCLLFIIIFAKQMTNPKIIKNLFVLIVLGLTMSAFYWFPAITELKNTNIISQIEGTADFRNHFVCLSQLWESQWGFGGSVPGCIDGLSFRLGKVEALISLAALIFVFKKNTKQKRFLIFALLGLLLSVFMTLEWSKFIWEMIPWFSYLQYPWRFLIFASFFSSILAGSIFSILSSEPIKKPLFYALSGALIIVLLLANGKLFNPQTIMPKADADYISRESLMFSISKISDEYLPSNFKKPNSINDIPSGNHAIPPIPTPIENLSNLISLIGLAGFVLAIIKKQYVR